MAFTGWVRVWLAHFPLLVLPPRLKAAPPPTIFRILTLSIPIALFSPSTPIPTPLHATLLCFAFTLPPFPSLSLSLFLLAAVARSCILLYTVFGLSLNQPFAERACVVAPCALQSKQDLPHINRDAYVQLAI